MSRKIHISKEKILELKKRNLNLWQIAKELGRGESTLYRKCKEYGISFKQESRLPPFEELKEFILEYGVRGTARILRTTHTYILHALSDKGYTYQTLLREYQDEIAKKQKPTLISGPCMIASDFHAPFTSIKWTERLIKVGKREHVKKIVIAGDFFDFDKLSWWAREAHQLEQTVDLEDELCFAERILDWLEEAFLEFWWLGGNHWFRLLRLISSTIKSERILGLVGRWQSEKHHFIEYFGWLIIDHKVRVTHPRRLRRKLDLTLSRDLSIKYPDQIIVVAHRHRGAEGFSPNGRPMLELGWMGDNERMRYYMHEDSAYYSWTNSFAMWKDGRLRHFTEYSYDWAKIDD